MRKRPEHPSAAARDAMITAAIALPAGADRLFLKAESMNFSDRTETYFIRGICPNGTPWTAAVPLSLFRAEADQRDAEYKKQRQQKGSLHDDQVTTEGEAGDGARALEPGSD